MPSMFRITETILYSLANFLPYLILVLYPFGSSMRFSKKNTIALIFLVTLCQIGIGIQVILFDPAHKAFFSILSTVTYAIFYCFTVKANWGKLLFMLLLISNVANFIVMFSKCMEYVFSPEMALQPYRITFFICTLCVQCLLFPILFWFIRKFIYPVLSYTGSNTIWHFLWLIPATFYLIWYYPIYFSQLQSSPTEIAIRIDNSIFLFFVNLGALLVYYVVCRMIQEMNTNLELKLKNQQLSMRNIQYQNLKERITDARQAKHDLRHHLKVIHAFAESENYTELKNYLKEYTQSLPLESPICYCEHPAVNSLLVWYGGHAKECDIHMEINVSIPAKIHVSEPDICILFGNLLENAMEACLTQNNSERLIRINGGIQSENVLVFTIDNTYETPICQTNSGAYLSSKHIGEGIGIASVCNIVAQYNGVASFRYDDKTFYASVLFGSAYDMAVPTKGSN